MHVPSMTPSCLGPFVYDAVVAVAVGRVTLSSFTAETGFALARGAKTAGRLCAGRDGPRGAESSGIGVAVRGVQRTVAMDSSHEVVARGGAVVTGVPTSSCSVEDGRVQKERRAVPLARAPAQECDVVRNAVSRGNTASCERAAAPSDGSGG